MAEDKPKRKYTIKDPGKFAASRKAGGQAVQKDADPEERKQRSAAGGKGRMDKMTADERAEVARKGAEAVNAARTEAERKAAASKAGQASADKRRKD